MAGLELQSEEKKWVFDNEDDTDGGILTISTRDEGGGIFLVMDIEGGENGAGFAFDLGEADQLCDAIQLTAKEAAQLKSWGE